MKVSVCMITYNQEKYIEQAIESVMMQETDFDYELVIGEDCSTDRTREIGIAYQNKYPDKIHLLLHDKNLGMMQNFVQTYRACSGQYIALLDGDDYWTLATKLQLQASFLDVNLHHAMCFTRASVFSEIEGHVLYYLPTPQYQGPILSIEDLLRFNSIATCSVMLRGGLLPEFPEGFLSLKMGDWPLYIMLAQYGKIGYIDQVAATYRIHQGGEWSVLDHARNLEGQLELYTCINANLNFKYDHLIRIQRSGAFYALALVYAGKGDLPRAKACARQCITERPFAQPVEKLAKLFLRLYAPRVHKLGKELATRFFSAMN
jgi:glycosyltransferase involved in cell wall biosynthesis